MSNSNHRYVAKAEGGIVWRIWNRTRRWWGNFFAEYPEAVLQVPNGSARPEELVRLSRESQSRERRLKMREREWACALSFARAELITGSELRKQLRVQSSIATIPMAYVPDLCAPIEIKAKINPW